jgi:hypothetical protein
MVSSSDILHAKVLIVDNEEVSALLLERLLRGAGYVSITSTTDPGEVCALHRKNGWRNGKHHFSLPGNQNSMGRKRSYVLWSVIKSAQGKLPEEANREKAS